jgi:curved DNA-binding protein CbpA
MSSHYQTLDVPETATASKIRAAYRKLALKLHPDRNPGDKDAGSRLKEISAAYSVLSDERQRERYDRERRRPFERPGRGRVEPRSTPPREDVLAAWLKAVQDALMRGSQPPPPPEMWGHVDIRWFTRRRGVKIQVTAMEGMSARMVPTFGGVDQGRSVPVTNPFQFELWKKKRK